MADLIVNHNGGYLLSGMNSRYSGFFLLINDKMIKILDDNFEGCKIRLEKNALSLKATKWTDLLLDVKESYDNNEFGRIYNSEKNMVVFNKEGSDFRVFVKFKGKFEKKKNDKWIKREYKDDIKRNSAPFERYVYSPFKFKGTIVLSAAMDENTVSKQLKVSKKRMPKQSGLDQLLVKNDVVGLYAGLPWFFQFWSRDELISLKALMLGGKNKEAKSIIMRNLNSISNDGRLPNQTFPLQEKTNADGIGWLFKRVQDFQRWSKSERELIIEKLEGSIKNISSHYIKEGLVYNNALETWMDTEWGGDDRSGFRIEIQCMFLNMLKLAYTFTRDENYLKEEEKMKKLVRDKFWNGKYLADGLDDWTKRPNVFIAAYIYPELLTKKEWEKCFQNILPSLWLSWGGLSTIEKRHPLYCKRHTGESTQSYHRGDSWFWMNNLAAIVMIRASKPFFKKFI